MSDTNGTTTKPKAWIDKHNITTFRDDVAVEEAQDLYDMMAQAFNAGLICGYKQGVEAATR
jgi:hypothetical protein